MSLWFIAPAAVLLIGAVPVLFAASRAAAETQGLAADLRDWEQLAPSLSAARGDLEAARERLGALRRR